ncbi:hypothetical protein P692DRAFT_20868314 [Suillus brevipes Sb2]|nr:hypothetical protein P692DRAFT_20868314 [Suillus brevipes Sb2]
MSKWNDGRADGRGDVNAKRAYGSLPPLPLRTHPALRIPMNDPTPPSNVYSDTVTTCIVKPPHICIQITPPHARAYNKGTGFGTYEYDIVSAGASSILLSTCARRNTPDMITIHLPNDVELVGIRSDSNWPRVCLDKYNTPLAPLATCPNLSLLSCLSSSHFYIAFILSQSVEVASSIHPVHQVVSESLPLSSLWNSQHLDIAFTVLQSISIGRTQDHVIS